MNAIFHPSSPQGIIQILLKEKHGQAGEQEGQRAQARNGNETSEKAILKRMKRDNLAITHRRDADQGHIYRIGPVPVVTGNPIETEYPDNGQRQHCYARPYDTQDNAP